MQDRELLVFPLLSMIGAIIVTLLFAIPLAGSRYFQDVARSSEDGNSAAYLLGVLILFLYYLILYTIVTYSNVALTGAALLRFRGGDPKVSDGFRVANSKLGTIVGFAAIQATVGLIASLLRGSGRESRNLVVQIIASIAASLIETAWYVITFLAVPIMVAEDAGPTEAIQRSGNLVRDTWGRQVVGSAGIGLVFGLISFAVFMLFFALFFLLANAGAGVVIVLGLLMLISLVAISLVGGALNSVYRLALYLYAQDKTATYFDEGLLRGAFVPAPAR
jgi:hypothetical protein